MSTVRDTPEITVMSVLSLLRSPRLSFLQTLLALLLSLLSLSSSHWCVGRQKVPKPLCSSSRRLRCTPVNGLTDASFSWETGDDRFIFPTFHAGLWTACEENIFTDAWEEKCRSFMALTPASEKGIVWLYVGMELLYVGLLSISSLLLLLQLCLLSWFPPLQRCAHLLNAFAAVCTVLGGLVGMVAHMMYMQVFQVTISHGPEDFKPHSFGYSWAFYVAWVAFTCCMSSGVSTLNNYTKKFLMVGPKNRSVFYPCRNFTFPPQPPSLSPLSPYFSPLLPPPPTCPAPHSPCPAPRSPHPAPHSPHPALLAPRPAPQPTDPTPLSPRPAPHSPHPALLSPRHAPQSPHPAFLSPRPSPASPHPAPRSQCPAHLSPHHTLLPPCPAPHSPSPAPRSQSPAPHSPCPAPRSPHHAPLSPSLSLLSPLSFASEFSEEFSPL
ncbi:germ cell-specific gene 1 protein-like [Pseudorasbora parva]|uniref:germ cell-specific gene 1 protein-like n=1 Tax=Pseudorasbora parva TaxID=51549 RepID=UPI00351E0D72